ncbi:MAG: hypothetical protein Q8M92_10675 [Candidatus Subteraquimicrobiales bacterium]|nr:hypothetical protein [Candidatus Subteraquimicrobiales bacterium]
MAIKTRKELIETIKHYEELGTSHGKIYYDAHKTRLKIKETYNELLKQYVKEE